MLRRLLPEAIPYDNAAPGAGAKGAYVLVATLDRPLAIARGRVAGVLVPGRYVYAGSARGGGGIAARLNRHLRPQKNIHWHIDHLTAVARPAAFALPGGSECGIVARLCAPGRFRAALPGFGSSDCRRCCMSGLSNIPLFKTIRSKNRSV